MMKFKSYSNNYIHYHINNIGAGYLLLDPLDRSKSYWEIYHWNKYRSWSQSIFK